MGTDWEDTFTAWSKPLSDTEEERCKNTLSMIRDAINNDPALSKFAIEVFVHGSYNNNTNVKQNSDIDVCICNRDFLFTDVPSGSNNSDFGINDAKYTYAEFKNQVEAALVNKFGRGSIKRGNKAIDIHASSYRVDADVVPCFEYRLYTGKRNLDFSHHYHKGIKFIAEDGQSKVNWPDHHYANGTKKNQDTNTRYKKIVRILKKLNLQMIEEKVISDGHISSFAVECLVWNVPNEYLIYHDNLAGSARNALLYLDKMMADYPICENWGEVSEMVYLLKGREALRKNARTFVIEALDYLKSR